MSKWIGGYECITPMRTAGSGSARWCMARRGRESFFLKEFLTPVYPAQEDTPLGIRQRERCEQFESRKQRLYSAISCVIGDTLTPVVDFFRFGQRYYAVSEALPQECMNAEAFAVWDAEEKRRVLYALALCLQRLHAQGIVHADLKPEHVLLMRHPDGFHPRLIDLDSGFLTDEPPEKDLEGDPVYLAPETFLRMAGERVKLNTAVDTFAFGAMIHQLWTGTLPSYDREKYQYLYEAALEEDEIVLSDSLPEAWRETLQRMLHRDPYQRPTDVRVTALFEREPVIERRRFRQLNGLSRLMRV